MNLFKKALVASAIVASFGASATATVSSTPLKLSAEGIADGVVATNTNLIFDVVVGTLHPAASTITLTFDNTVDLDNIAGGAVANTPANGTGLVAGGDVKFDYGTGSFTFDNVVIDNNDQSKGEQDSISFDINLGNPLTASSAFRISLLNTKVDISGAASVSYASVDSASAAIEIGSGTVATEVSQFSFSLKSDFDGIVNRNTPTVFLDTTDIDVVVYNYSNNETLGAALTAPVAQLDISGDFDSLVFGDFLGTTLAATGATAPGTPLVAGATTMSPGDDEVGLALLNVNSAVDGTVTEITVTFNETNGTVIPATGNITAEMSINGTNGTVSGDVIIATAVASGEWAIDATIINVPYFPVGYEGTSTSVHFANEKAAVADVIVTAIDDEGNTYGPLDLGMDLAGDTVTKVGQATIMALFGLTESTKLSVTFNIDADDGDVNAYAFTSSAVGRTEISNSQLKGK